MADFSIALSSMQKVKTVEIKGLGVLTVRRVGSGEELELSRNSRRLNKLIKELSSIDFLKFNETSPEDLKKIKKLNKRVDEISDEIEEIKKFEHETYKNCLSDDKNGEVVKVIMNTLTNEARNELFKKIFGKVRPLETPQNVTESEVKEDE